MLISLYIPVHNRTYDLKQAMQKPLDLYITTIYLKRPRLEHKEMDFLDPTEIKLFLKEVDSSWD